MEELEDALEATKGFEGQTASVEVPAQVLASLHYLLREMAADRALEAQS